MHFDLKPENILTNSKGEVKIADFGISKIMGEDTGDFFKNITGTRLYQAPEAWGFNEAKGRPIDIWALGVTFFYLTFGFHPFNGRNEEALLKNIMTKEVSCPEGGDPLFADLISKCLIKSSDKRINLYQLMKHDWITKNGRYPIARETRRHLHVPGRQGSPAMTVTTLETQIFAISKLKARFCRNMKRAVAERRIKEAKSLNKKLMKKNTNY